MVLVSARAYKYHVDGVHKGTIEFVECAGDQLLRWCSNTTGFGTLWHGWWALSDETIPRGWVQGHLGNIGEDWMQPHTGFTFEVIRVELLSRIPAMAGFDYNSRLILLT